MKNVFETEARKNIYDFILNAPGSHLREIGRRLGISLGHLRYHLSILEKNGLIVSKRNGYYKRYFVKKHLDAGLVEVFFTLRQRNTRRIVLYLLNHSDITHKDLLKVFNFAPSTLSLYLNNLVKKKVIQRVKHGRENKYRITDERKVLRVLRTYKESFMDKLVDAALEIYQESYYY